MDKIYLVTGAAGHLGNVITRKLAKGGKMVRALLLPCEQYIPKNVEIFYGNVCKIDELKPCFDNLGGRDLIVIHCAGIVSISSGFNQLVYDVNVTGTKNIVDLCLQTGVSRLVYVSSVHAIPEKPTGVVISEITDFHADRVVGAYAKTKAEATAYVLAATTRGLDACVVHPSGIAGPYDYGKGHLTTLVLDYYKHRLVVGIKGGYDFVDVRDVADGIISACGKGRKGECYILSNEYYGVHEVLMMLHEITGKKEIKHFLPLWFIRAVAPLAELYYKLLKQTPLFTAYSVGTLNSNSLFSNQKAKDELGYSARGMKTTLTDTITWLKQKGRL